MKRSYPKLGIRENGDSFTVKTTGERRGAGIHDSSYADMSVPPASGHEGRLEVCHYIPIFIPIGCSMVTSKRFIFMGSNRT
jgi:hypothetical protein